MSKIYIDLPVLSQFSNGTKCIKDLRDYLINYGFEVSSVFRRTQISKIKSFFFRTNIFDNEKCQFFNAKRNDWLIACDTTPLYLLKIARKKGLNIAWWQLAPYNLSGNNIFPIPGECSLPFSSYSDPNVNDFFYYQPSIDNEWINALNNENSIADKKSSICIYTGKGRLKMLPELIRKLCVKYEINLITRKFPSSRKEYFRLLDESIGLMSFDEMSQTNLEAASLGIPVFIVNSLFPEKSIEKFIVKKYTERITRSAEVFFEMVSNKNKRFPKLKQTYLESFNDASFKKIVGLIKNKESYEKVTESSLNNFKIHTKGLKKKNLIFPFFLWGETFGIVLVSVYLANIKNNKRFKLIVF